MVLVGHTRSAHATTVEKPARTAPMDGFSALKRVICLQTIEKSVQSSRCSPEIGAGEGIGATRYDAITHGMIPFRLPMQA